MVVGEELQRFEDLEVWQKAQALAVLIYAYTKSFPAEERFGLISQLKRAASSISANIAEGFGRNSLKDKLHFYTMAYGSLLEVKNFMYLARRLNYIQEDQNSKLIREIEVYQRLLNGLLRSIRRRLA